MINCTETVFTGDYSSCYVELVSVHSKEGGGSETAPEDYLPSPAADALRIVNELLAEFISVAVRGIGDDMLDIDERSGAVVVWLRHVVGGSLDNAVDEAWRTRGIPIEASAFTKCQLHRPVHDKLGGSAGDDDGITRNWTSVSTQHAISTRLDALRRPAISTP
ncbi:MAG TPA: hypothetical protein VG247_17420 [Pseudonocardiaceae bacterium]|jgi:hypothetical protein|nr:hypothetical protein [Pseudonocardiaceae bacterium]